MTEKNAQWEGIVGAARVQVQERFKEIFQSLDFGAYIRPEHYFVSYIFKTTEEMNRAEKSGLLEKINDYHRKCLLENGYPQEAIKDCCFASQEECEKRYNGNWLYFYK